MSVRRLASVARQRLRRHLLDSLDERGLVWGTRVEFPRPQSCVLSPFEEGLPGPGEVLVETELTLVSPGTERAVYLALPNAPATHPHVPGYSLVGRVVACGSGSSVREGERVVTSGPHASLHLSPAARAIPVPAGVAPEAAVLTQLGFIALQGIRRAAVEPGDTVAVLGCGPIGQLAAQLARLAGAQVFAVATSPERLAVARACGIEGVNARQEPDRLASLEADIVVDATGQPQAVHDACRAVRRGGRVVLLGSNRGATTRLDLAAWRHKALVLIGAHTSSVPQSDPSPRSWTWRRECETFLGLLCQGRLQHAPLITRRVTPDRAAEVYRDLARPDDRSVAVLFDWSAPGAWRSRIETVSPLRVAAAGARRLLGRVAPASPVFLTRRGDGRVLRFGLIGCGEIAVDSAAALRGAANATLTFAADPEIALARSLAAATGAHATERVEELLRSPEVDAVLISTPHHLHAPLAIQAAEAGKHVVVEKPMATSVADCDRMIAAAERHGVRLSVCYCQRYDPRVQRARMLLAAGVLGEVLSTRITFGQHRPAAYWTQGLSGRTAGDWRGRRATAGGGVLIMNACHLLDYMGWLVGRAVAEVTACTATLVHDVEVEDTVAMSYRYAGGGLGSLEATTAVAGPGAFEQVLRGRDGQLQLAPELRFWSQRTIQGYEPARWHAVRGLPRAAERRHYFEAFAQAVLDGSAPPVTPGEARDVQAVIEAAYRAAELGRAVRTEELAR